MNRDIRIEHTGTINHVWVVRPTRPLASEIVAYFDILELSLHEGKEVEDKIGEGVLKWDGCLHFTLGTLDRYMHFDGPEDAELVPKMAEAIYEKLGPSITGWSRT